MKLTWFARSVLRLQIGGAIVVVDPADAPEGIDAGELVSGADRVIGAAGENLPDLPADWQRARPGRLIDAPASAAPDLGVWRLGPASLLLAASGEPTVILASTHDAIAWGRFADEAVVVLTGAPDAMAATGAALLAAARPRLVALAADASAADAAFAALAPGLGGASLMILEPGLAVES